MSSPERKKSRPRVVQNGSGSYTLAGFRKFCRRLILENGEAFKLHDYEAEIVADHFGGARRTVVIIGKKNGKTTLMAALGLYHMDTVPNPKVLIAASARDQATIIFEQAEGLVKRSGLETRFKVQPGYRRMRLHDSPGEMKVLAGDYDTAEGQIPTLALVDELHVHRDMRLTTSLYLGLVPRNGKMIIISTAGSAQDSPLGRLREEAHALPTFKRDYARKKNYAVSENGALVWHEWCLDPGDDVDDMRVVKTANPAPWHTIASLKEFRGGVSAFEWRRFACGIWTEGEEPWLQPEVWDALGDPDLEITPDEPVILGVDIGQQVQDTGLVLVALRDVYAAEAVILHPPNDLTDIEEEVRRICSSYNVQAVAYDSTGAFQRSGEVLYQAGLPMLEWPHREQRLAKASAVLLQAVQDGRLAHNGDPAFRAHVLAGTTKQYERGWRLVKDFRTRRSVGALIALAMAVQVATEFEPEVLIASM